jgi:hypothetical protein
VGTASEFVAKFGTWGAIRRIGWEACFLENMGMIEIILTVCAIANPSYCEEKYLQFTFDGSINQCMMAAQPYIAEWIGKHPEWQVTKWSCDYPGHEKRRI